MIAAGMQKKISLGNMDAKRDWGFAPEYCEGMWRILHHEKAEDFVLATGETHTVREFTELTFKELGIEIEWKGNGANEKGYIKSVNRDTAKSLVDYDKNASLYKHNFVDLKEGALLVEVDPGYYRPTEVELLIGNASKAEKVLGWKAKTKFSDLVKLMIQSDMGKVLTRGY